MEKQGFEVCVAESAQEVAAACNLIITATPAKKPLLYSKDIQPGTHITAVGGRHPGETRAGTGNFSPVGGSGCRQPEPGAITRRSIPSSSPRGTFPYKNS